MQASTWLLVLFIWWPCFTHYFRCELCGCCYYIDTIDITSLSYRPRTTGHFCCRCTNISYLEIRHKSCILAMA